MLLKDSSKLTALEGIHELHDRMKEIIQTENAKRKKVKKKKKTTQNTIQELWDNSK